MKTKLSLVVLFFLFSLNCFAQDSLDNIPNNKRLKLELNTGGTFQLDHSINTGFTTRDFTTGYFEFGINYEFIDNFEFGVSLGTNKFNRIRHTHYQYIDETPPLDTLVGIPANNTYGNFEWGAFNLRYNFSKMCFTGLKVGFNYNDHDFLGMNVGINIIDSDNWELNSIAQLFTRINYSNFNINSYQLNLLFSVRYKIDVSGIEL